MSALLDAVADLDRRIAAAYRELGVARARFSEAPSGAVVTACETAETLLNGLLERRFALTHGRVDDTDAATARLAVGTV